MLILHILHIIYIQFIKSGPLKTEWIFPSYSLYGYILPFFIYYSVELAL